MVLCECSRFIRKEVINPSKLLWDERGTDNGPRDFPGTFISNSIVSALPSMQRCQAWYLSAIMKEEKAVLAMSILTRSEIGIMLEKRIMNRTSDCMAASGAPPLRSTRITDRANERANNILETLLISRSTSPTCETHGIAI
jgi:hypothetical protein